MTGCSTVMTEMPLLLFRLLGVSLLTLGFLASFLSCLGGAPKIDFPLSMFSLAKSFLTLVFSKD